MQTQQGETNAQETVREQSNVSSASGQTPESMPDKDERKGAGGGSEFDTSAIAKEAERMTEEARAVWDRAVDKMRKPSVGAAVAGAAVLAAGAVWGASEAAVAAIAAYAVFRMLRRRGAGREREPASGAERSGRAEQRA